MAESALSSEKAAAILLIVGGFGPIALGIVLALTGNLAAMYAGPDEMTVNLALRRWTFRLAGLAMILALFGFGLLTPLLHARGERALSTIALTAFFLATLGWLIELTVTSSIGEIAAREFADTGSIPAYWKPIRYWVNVGLQQGYVFLGLVSVAAFGASLLQAQLAPAWAGWITLAWAAFWLAIELLTGTTIPAVFLIISAVIGFGLLMRG